MKIFIDNGHGLMTAGKRSPDGQFPEPFYNREIARRVVSDLRDRGLDAELLVPEDDDISLGEKRWLIYESDLGFVTRLGLRLLVRITESDAKAQFVTFAEIQSFQILTTAFVVCKKAYRTAKTY